jgi:tetratricopeptide (TPR) repeat protein
MAQLHAGRYERAMEIHTRLAAQSGAGPVYGLGGQTMVFAMVGRTDDYASLAEEAVCAARDLGNPFFLAKALYGLGLALARKEPARALETFHQALAYAREHRQVLVEASIYRDAARVETVSGDIGAALNLYDFAIDVQHRSGNLANLAVTFASLSVCFDRLERPEIAATLYGITTHISAREPGIRRSVLGRMREALGDAAFERCVAAGAAMEPADAVQYAREQIRCAREELQPSGAR